IYIGQMLRGLTVDTLRVHVCLLIAGSFILGGVAGALLFQLMREHTLLIPAALTGLCGLSYSMYCQYSAKDETQHQDESPGA
ncbi:MAG: DUF1275 domain-containing protein, partial [Rhodanobacter sp.]